MGETEQRAGEVGAVERGQAISGAGEAKGETKKDQAAGESVETAAGPGMQDSASTGAHDSGFSAAQSLAQPDVQDPALSEIQLPAPSEEVVRLKAELEEVRSRGLEAYRRALLAENRGKVVAGLVRGATFEEMDGSLEGARAAFEEAKAAAMAEMVASQVPVGNPVRQGPSLAAMTPLEKIAQGLKRD